MIDGMGNSYCDWCGKRDNDEGTQNRMYNIGKAKSVMIVEICSPKCGEMLKKHEHELRLTLGSVNQRVIGMHVILGNKKLAKQFQDYATGPVMDGED